MPINHTIPIFPDIGVKTLKKTNSIQCILCFLPRTFLRVPMCSGGVSGWWPEGEIGSFWRLKYGCQMSASHWGPQRRQQSWLQMQEPTLPWGLLKIQGTDSHLELTQKEKAGTPRTSQPVAVWLFPWPVFIRELNRPKSSQLIPHTSTRGWAGSLLSHQLKPSEAVGILCIFYF